jgi:hypothetical protein
MIAKINIWGNEYELSVVHWGTRGINHVSFYDKYREYRTVFDDECDFETAITWEQKNNPLTAISE